MFRSSFLEINHPVEENMEKFGVGHGGKIGSKNIFMIWKTTEKNRVNVPRPVMIFELENRKGACVDHAPLAASGLFAIRAKTCIGNTKNRLDVSSGQDTADRFKALGCGPDDNGMGCVEVGLVGCRIDNIKTLGSSRVLLWADKK